MNEWKLVADEVAKATAKFPTWPTDPLHALAVLGEEFGELTQAVLQHTYEPHKSTLDDVRTESLQTAAMALRFLTSIDRYEFERGHQHEQAAAPSPPADPVPLSEWQEQQAEIARLKGDFGRLKDAHALAVRFIADRDAEIARLREAGVGYSQQTVDAITKEREQLRAENERLREMVKLHCDPFYMTPEDQALWEALRRESGDE
jgi:NTP pyrophosphatase (non-canonical NTP hydrolase)